MRKNTYNYKSALTLVELIMALVLLSFVVLAITGIDIGARKLLSAIDKETATLMDVSPAMEHMQKWLSLATGDDDNPGVVLIANGIDFRVDYDANDSCRNTPNNYNDDLWKRYRLNGNGLRYYPNRTIPGVYNVLATRVNNFFVDFNQAAANFYVRVRLTAHYIPSQAAGVDNPRVILESDISPRPHSSN